MDYEGFMTSDQLAAYLQVSAAWVRESCRRDKLPYIKLGRQYRFSKDQIDLTLKEANPFT